VFDRALDLDDRYLAVDERRDHVACDKIDLHFACKECGVVGWKGVRSEAKGSLSVLMLVEACVSTYSIAKFGKLCRKLPMYA
jgi:hypothetical protein